MAPKLLLLAILLYSPFYFGLIDASPGALNVVARSSVKVPGVTGHGALAYSSGSQLSLSNVSFDYGSKYNPTALRMEHFGPIDAVPKRRDGSAMNDANDVNVKNKRRSTKISGTSKEKEKATKKGLQNSVGDAIPKRGEGKSMNGANANDGIGKKKRRSSKIIGRSREEGTQSRAENGLNMQGLQHPVKDHQLTPEEIENKQLYENVMQMLSSDEQQEVHDRMERMLVDANKIDPDNWNYRALHPELLKMVLAYSLVEFVHHRPDAVLEDLLGPEIKNNAEFMAAIDKGNSAMKKQIVSTFFVQNKLDQESDEQKKKFWESYHLRDYDEKLPLIQKLKNAFKFYKMEKETAIIDKFMAKKGLNSEVKKDKFKEVYAQMTRDIISSDEPMNVNLENAFKEYKKKYTHWYWVRKHFNDANETAKYVEMETQSGDDKERENSKNQEKTPKEPDENSKKQEENWKKQEENTEEEEETTPNELKGNPIVKTFMDGINFNWDSNKEKRKEEKQEFWKCYKSLQPTYNATFPVVLQLQKAYEKYETEQENKAIKTFMNENKLTFNSQVKKDKFREVYAHTTRDIISSSLEPMDVKLQKAFEEYKKKYNRWYWLRQRIPSIIGKKKEEEDTK